MSMGSGTADMLALLAAATGTAPVLATGTAPDVSLGRVFLTLLFCLLLAGAAIWVLRNRYGIALPSVLRRPEGARLRLIERISLGPQASASLIALDGQGYLVVASLNALSVNPLDPAPPDESVT